MYVCMYVFFIKRKRKRVFFLFVKKKHTNHTYQTGDNATNVFCDFKHSRHRAWIDEFVFDFLLRYQRNGILASHTDRRFARRFHSLKGIFCECHTEYATNHHHHQHVRHYIEPNNNCKMEKNNKREFFRSVVAKNRVVFQKRKRKSNNIEL